MLLQMSDDAARLRFMLDKSKAVELAAVLDWYREMGAEEVIGETPIDWLQRGDVAPGNGFSASPSPPQAAGAQPKALPTTPAQQISPPARRPPSPAPGAPAPRQFPATA